MIFVALVALVVLFVGWRLARRRRAGVLAGLDAEKPTFQVQPPSRAVGKRRTELL